MLEVSFEQQRNIFKHELFKVFDYVDLEKARKAKHDIYNGEWNNENLLEIIIFASYAGSLLRISYYKFVHKLGFDARALADAAIFIYVFQNVYWFELENHLRDPIVKKAIKRTRYPDWTKHGLIGGHTSNLIKMGNKFSEYMDGLKTQEEYQAS